MNLDELLDKLNYRDSPNFLRKGTREFRSACDYGHIFRQASKAPCRLAGVYTLHEGENASVVPIVYVCWARSEADVSNIHRLVWNQDVVPFVIICSPGGVRLYSGFQYHRPGASMASDALRVVKKLNDLSDFIADSIDDGRLWRGWGSHVTPETRVDWKLLKNLQHLDRLLQKNGSLKRDATHALIGKYVYLRYLRDRKILSDEKLASWDLDAKDIFSRDAKRAKVREVDHRLNEWLNGSVFPLALSGPDAPSADDIRLVAGTFQGDEPLPGGDVQLALDFQAYDFSYIPIETVSVIYEQFLHAPDEDGQASRGKEAGAYYTPIPVVNFMLSQLEESQPLRKGMRVFDPSCGSGAFLVQCYRRFIEQEFRPTENKLPSPDNLKELLQESIFGIDRDEDACSVTELSLILTLLDYVDPPDLEPKNRHQFKLPLLRGRNIFRGDFFPEKSGKRHILAGQKFDWIVGNPPWKKLKSKTLKEDDRPAWNWITQPENQRDFPVGNYQVAQAFAWRVASFAADQCEISLLLPAMTLFENPSRHFRKAFFRRMLVHSVANFSNLAEVLFAGRSRVPAAAFFYRARSESSLPSSEERVTTYSPLVANQEATRPTKPDRRTEAWSIVVNASEVRDIPLAQVAGGSGLPWKLASWGSQLDKRLLDRLRRMFPSFESLETDRILLASEGLQLRAKSASESLEYVKEVIGKDTVDVTKLEELRGVFYFPTNARVAIDASRAFAREGRATLPLSVCRPPHVIVSAARNFAVFSNDFLVVPGRQIGITSPSNNADLLKTLAVFLSSDFAYYHDFLTSTQFGVQRGRSTLGTLRRMPIPIATLARAEQSAWTKLHSRLIKISPHKLANEKQQERSLFEEKDDSDNRVELLVKLNDLVSDALQLDRHERALVYDLVHVRKYLNDGKIEGAATRPPTKAEIREFAECFKDELDAFIGDEISKRYAVAVIYDGNSGMIRTDLTADRQAATSVEVVRAEPEMRNQLSKVRQRLSSEFAQWVYFNRNLRVYEGTCTYNLKPMQRFHWTESQAMIDARELIAETLTAKEEAR